MIVILDPGHGGIDKQGRYTTSPKKMHQFPSGEFSYEGVFNRNIMAKVKQILNLVEGVKVYTTVREDDPTDLPLDKRVEFVNKFNKKTTVLISFHSNASPNHNARGIELYTTVGRTRADYLAGYIAREFIQELKTFDVTYRFNSISNLQDFDKEVDFYMLRKTKCPSVLLENLFFDQYDDFQLLKDENFTDRLALAIAEGVIEFKNKRINKIDEL